MKTDIPVYNIKYPVTMSYLLIWMDGGEYEDEYNQIETAFWTREVGVGVGDVANKGMAAGRAVVFVVLSENINVNINVNINQHIV